MLENIVWLSLSGVWSTVWGKQHNCLILKFNYCLLDDKLPFHTCNIVRTCETWTTFIYMWWQTFTCQYCLLNRVQYRSMNNYIHLYFTLVTGIYIRLELDNVSAWKKQQITFHSTPFFWLFQQKHRTWNTTLEDVYYVHHCNYQSLNVSCCPSLLHNVSPNILLD